MSAGEPTPRPATCPNLSTCVKRTVQQQLKECRCRFPEGGVPGVSWKLSDVDERFLRSLRIDPEVPKK